MLVVIIIFVLFALIFLSEVKPIMNSIVGVVIFGLPLFFLNKLLVGVSAFPSSIVFGVVSIIIYFFAICSILFEDAKNEFTDSIGLFVSGIVFFCMGYGVFLENTNSYLGETLFKGGTGEWFSLVFHMARDAIIPVDFIRGFSSEMISPKALVDGSSVFIYGFTFLIQFAIGCFVFCFMRHFEKIA